MKKIFVLLFSIGLIIVIVQSFLSNNEKEKSVLQNQINQVVSDKYWIEFSSQNNKINNCYIDEYLDSKDSIQLSDVLDVTHKLVFFFSESNCSECVKSELQNLAKFSNIIDKENIVIISSFNNNRKRWMREVPYKILNVRNQKLGLILESKNTPFYFLLDNKLEAMSVFIPIKEYPALTERYFEIIKENYFKTHGH